MDQSPVVNPPGPVINIGIIRHNSSVACPATARIDTDGDAAVSPLSCPMAGGHMRCYGASLA